MTPLALALLSSTAAAEGRKYAEAITAFDALAKKNPAFRLAAMRMARAKAKLADKR